MGTDGSTVVVLVDEWMGMDGDTVGWTEVLLVALDGDTEVLLLRFNDKSGG
jgi:hypothetical protein